MPITIHGNSYITVAERVQAAHKELEKLTITTEVLFTEPVVIKATVITEAGTFTGISAADPTKVIEKKSPYEVAETSAVGRALGFAGFGIVEGIATADEVKKATTGIIEENDPEFAPHPSVASPPQQTSPKSHIMATTKQVGYIGSLMKAQGIEPDVVYKKYGISSRNELTGVQASELIEQLLKKTFQP